MSKEKFEYQFARPGEPNEIEVLPASDQGIHVTKGEDGCYRVVRVHVSLLDIEDHECDEASVLAGTIAGAVDNFLPQARSAQDMIPFATALTDWISERRVDASLRDHENLMCYSAQIERDWNKYVYVIATALIVALGLGEHTVHAQYAQEVLDKCAAATKTRPQFTERDVYYNDCLQRRGDIPPPPDTRSQDQILVDKFNDQYDGSRAASTSEIESVRSGMQKLLKDADSAKFLDVQVRSRTDDPHSLWICGQLNAKNSMDAYVGYHAFEAMRVAEAQQALLLHLDSDDDELAANNCRSRKMYIE